MVKLILQIYPVIPAESEAEREALRPIGRNVDRYQQTVRDLDDVVRAADKLGLWGVSSIEHHFHSEGYEVGPNPGVMMSRWAAITENIKVGSLGYVMSAASPLRVAEETAILDHITGGRIFVGVARGYQNRWTEVLGQHLGNRATLSDKSEADQINREIFEEQVQMVIDAWTQESIEHKSQRWQVPYPHDEGIANWPMADWTERLGANGEMGPDGNVHRISVVPAPFTQPHPPVFVASNESVETVQFAGRHNFVPGYFTPIERAASHGQAYVDAARSAGTDYALGQNQMVVRWIEHGDTEQQARDRIAEHSADIFKHFYAPFFEVFPSGAGKDRKLAPRDATRESLVDPILKTGLWVAGTVDQMLEQFVEQWKVFPAEYIMWVTHFAQEPKEHIIHNMEVMMKEIKPTLDEMTRYD
jgi:alkanesulfonate monooxygenase SsuD/methylene tetrahydromethanopterin reductase-like flavin-dependent oxidoreductase (luciferase family)